MQAVVVTGTRTSNRTASDSMSPIQVLNAKSLNQTGKLGLQEILSDVLPSFDLPSQAGGNMSSIIREATLRGLNPDQVLILVNGKRRHPSSIVNVAGSIGVGAQPVDLSMIPPNSIERIEVLTDGAAAQYGSDAIAGVINIILKSDDHGGDAVVQAGQFYKEDGKGIQFGGNSGFKLGSDGFLNLSTMLQWQNLTNRAIGATLTPIYYSGDPRNSVPDGIVYRGYGIPQVYTQSFSFNLAKPLIDGITLYSFGNYAHSDGRNWVGYRAASNSNNVLAIYPNGFEPRLITNQNDYSLTEGLKGEALFGWNWDLSTTLGRNADNISLVDSVNPTYGLDSPTSFNEGSLISTEVTNSLDFVRSFDTGWFAAPLATAFGFEYRIDGYGIRAGQVESYANGGQPQLTGPSAGQFVDVPGAQALAGFRPADSGDHWRDNTSAYVDFETSVMKDWEVGLAGRFEHYTDFGDDTTGKLSTRYQFTPAVAMRGTVSTGFRAPSVGQEYYSASATSQYKGVDYNVVNLPVNSTAAELLGAQPLKPEKSVSYSVGLVLKPIDKMTLTIDGYIVDIKDRIVESASIGLEPSGAINPGVATALEGQGIDGVDVGRYFLNGVGTRTAGIDLVDTYRYSFGKYGRLVWTTAFSAIHTKVTSVTSEAQQTLYGTQVFNQLSQDYITMALPNNKLILTADYSVGRWSMLLRNTRYGSLTAPSTVSNGYSHQGSKWLTDAELGYDLTLHAHLAAGAQNLFSIYPDRTNPNNFVASTFNGAQIYNSDSPFGISGGYYYVRAGYTW